MIYSSSHKILTREQLKQKLEIWRLKGNKIVFTNGCFDLMHIGHADYLEKAKAAGFEGANVKSKLIVGLNSDASVTKLKGDPRPYTDQDARAKMIAALESTDAIVIFEENTPENLIHFIRPDFLVKGADYTEDQVAGATFVKSYGGKIALIPLVEGYSTSALINSIKK